MKKITNLLLLIFISVSTLSASIKIDSIKVVNSKCLNNGRITVYASSNSQIFYSVVAGPSTFTQQTGNFFEGLGLGAYKVMVVNLLNEKDSATIMVLSSYVINDFTQIFIPTTCSNNADGIIIGNPDAGKGIKPFTWRLRNNNTGVEKTQTNDTFKNLPKGDYTMYQMDSCLNTTVHNFELKNSITGFTNISASISSLNCTKTIINTNFSTYEPTPPIWIKYKYKNTIISKAPTVVYGSYIIDTFNFKMYPGEIIDIVLYNKCGDSFFRQEYVNSNLNFCYEKIGCDTQKCNISSALKFKKIIYTTKNGIQLYDSLNNYSLNVIIPNIQALDTIQYKIITTCDDTLVYTYRFSKIIDLYNLYYNHVDDTNCGIKRVYNLNYTSCERVKDSVNIKLYDKSTGNLVEDSTVVNNFYYNFQDHIPNRWYYYVITDGCGAQGFDSFYWAKPITPTLSFSVRKDYFKICLDSTIKVELLINKSNVKIFSFTGPKTVVNTKAKYGFIDSINYSGIIGQNSFYTVSNLGIGKYNISVKDSCTGMILSDSFEVFPDEVSNSFYNYTPITACQDNNKLILNLNSKFKSGLPNRELGGTYSIFNYQTNKYIALGKQFRYNSVSNYEYFDTFKYLQEGKYQLMLSYDYSGYGYATKTQTCNHIIDTLIIPPYSRPEIGVVLKIVCNNKTYVQLQPDSSFGIYPYKYEINLGPQTYPMQYSNIFQLNQLGNYRSKIWDTCGNANTLVFYVDTIKFKPIQINDSSCATDRTVLKSQSSIFFTYKWTRPNGSIYWGDSIVIDPVMASDVGLYKVTRYVDFYGCKDSVFNTYQLRKSKVFDTTKIIKDGDSVFFNKKQIKKRGTYQETIPMTPCDSFSVLHLVVLDSFYNFNIYDTICRGDSFHFRGKTYTKKGMYKDTIDVFAQFDTIYHIHIHEHPFTTVTKSPIFVCDTYVDFKGVKHVESFVLDSSIKAKNGCDSIVNLTPVTIYKPIVKVVKIEGCGNLIFKNKIYFNTVKGADYDRYKSTTTGCDSFVVQYDVYVYPKPLISYIINKPLPFYQFDSVTITGIGGVSYFWDYNGYRAQSIKYIPADTGLGKIKLVIVDANGCTDSVWIDISVRLPLCSTYDIPSAFSPNGDGINDTFVPNTCQDVSIKVFSVYNRMGVKMYQSTTTAGWDGNYLGFPAPIDTYYCFAEFYTLSGVKVRSGSFKLIR